MKPAERRTTPVTDFRREILSFVKQKGEVTVQEAADRFAITHEGARRQFLQLEKEGWIVRRTRHERHQSAGRPTLGFALTPAGDHLFPKHYDVLSLELIDAVVRTAGPEGLRALLAAVVEKQAEKWEPKLRGRTLEQKLELLKGLYTDGDPYMAVQRSGPEIGLIENNCPFLNVAMRRPQVCSLSVGLLQRLLGVRVVREEKFQNGDRRCVFRILRDQPVAADVPFTFETPAASGQP